jgi:RNA polymerase sigma-70 factor, ECF subfamily
VTATLERQAGAEPDEAHLIERLRRGDGAAFDVLVLRHTRRAFALAHRILGQREDAEDLVQEAFIAALEHIDSFDARRPFAPWFFRIVVNRALNARKRLARHPAEEVGPHLAADGALPSASVEQREVQRRVRSALERLPERQRTIIQLSGFDGLSSAEIGEVLGMPAGTVRWELHQARRSLRSELAACKEGGS